MKWKPHLLIDCNLLEAALWKRSYGYIIIMRKKLLFHIVYCKRENHLPQVYFIGHLRTVSGLSQIFFTAFAYKMNLKKAKNSEVV